MKRVGLQIGTLLAMLSLSLGPLQASPRGIDAEQMRDEPWSYPPSGYSYSLHDTRVDDLSDSVTTLPAFTEPSLYMSKHGLYRYAYFEKTGRWLDLNAVDLALSEPLDENQW